MIASQEFKDAIIAAGLTPPDEPIGDGKLHRFSSNGKPRNTDGWYVFHDDERPAGAFGCNRTQVDVKWSSKNKQTFTPEEKAAWRKRMDEAKAQRDADKAREHQECADKAADMWERAVGCAHPYAERKQITTEGARVLNGELLIPVYQGPKILVGLQRIKEDGEKLFLKGTEKQGNYMVMGRPSADKPVVICEGWATGVSIRMATGLCVVVAFDAGNLLHVAPKIRKAMQDAQIIIASDDDSIKGNDTGIKAATQAALQIKARIALPKWSTPDRGQGTDFNDLHISEGLDTVKAQILSAYDPSMVDNQPQVNAASDLTAQAANNPASGGAVTSQAVAAAPFSSIHEQDPIHHDTALYGGEGGDVATRQNAALDLNPLSQEAWLDFTTGWVYVEDSKRFIHLKTMRQLTSDAFNMAHAAVFAAHAPVEAGKKPNAALFLMKSSLCPVVHNTMYLPVMFNGDQIFAIDGIRYLNTYSDIWTPKTDENWQQHDAWQICLNHIKEILPDDWNDVLMFMAHNVQHPGRKILWAPIIVGVQGDGKTVLSKIMAAAMGPKNTKVVGMQATRSDFNSWAEGSCLAVFEEIRAPGHSRHDFMNKLKELITNDVIDVTAKGRDPRNIVNTQNYMALSNFKDALAIDEHDRRWGVFFTRFKNHTEVADSFDQAYWAKLNDYAIKGFPEVIRGWLLNVDISGFDRNARPKITDAKRMMTTSSMSEHAQSVKEAIDHGLKGLSNDVVSTSCLNEALIRIDRMAINTSRMSKALESLGYKKAGFVKWESSTHRVWVREDMEIDGSSKSRDKIRDLLNETTF